MVACRVFIGLPEVMVFAAIHKPKMNKLVAIGCVLSRANVSALSVVHTKRQLLMLLHILQVTQVVFILL